MNCDERRVWSTTTNRLNPLKRHLTVSAVVFAAFLVAGSGVGPAAGKPRRIDCLRSGTTLGMSSQVRLFRIGDNVDHYLYACRLRGRRVRSLGYFLENTEGPDKATVAGRYVASDYFVCDRGDGCTGRVGVDDVRRRRYRVAPTGPGRIGSLILTDRGIAAWIRDGAGYGMTPSSPAVRSVQVLLADGAHRLDEGTDIDVNSLARAGSRLYWLKGGAPRTATLEEAKRAPLVPADPKPRGG